MPRTDEAEWFINAVYSAIQEIPRGRVTSYGHIALLLGYPKRPRQIGTSLKHLPSPSADPDPDVTSFYHSGNVPWQRVINSRGMISHRRGPGSAERQAEVLRGEGVEVSEDAMGELYVDFGRFGWFPDVLPSEEGLDSDGDSNSNGNGDGDGDGNGDGDMRQ
ncbi:DNA binding methylated-DNA--cysteine S-methyltransferase [Aspergillus sclerotiicarbonarius CBS 121057]|uniref:DNA binding methylated-DNA--cysteine S-methyltransferase n=1 Tax=Aspergillus sclerotiicarbonarius (strain CBS 121057 / IBT 28362) TaxID=1448318 RepID=A0A319F275_ASPSB|nr:DNA binding methylated-DNA--cysteine S-methyltransferase [Aspergillus sclerotiicarbonarius CBS 121057]